MRMERAKEGLWLHLIESVPLPERDELLSLVGRGLVDTNEVRKKRFRDICLSISF